MRDVAEVVRLREWACIAEGAARGRAISDRSEEFSMVAWGVCDERLRWLEVFERALREQDVFAVIGEQHAFVSNKEDTAAPFADDRIVFPDIGFRCALVPVDFARGHLAAWAVFIDGMH